MINFESVLGKARMLILLDKRNQRMDEDKSTIQIVTSIKDRISSFYPDQVNAMIERRLMVGENEKKKLAEERIDDELADDIIEENNDEGD